MTTPPRLREPALTRKWLGGEHSQAASCKIPTTRDSPSKEGLTPTDVIQLLKDPRHKILRARVTREVLKDFKAIVDVKEMLGACDVVGVSREAYSSIFKIFKSSVAQRFKNLAMPLPTPWSCMDKKQHTC